MTSPDLIERRHSQHLKVLNLPEARHEWRWLSILTKRASSTNVAEEAERIFEEVTYLSRINDFTGVQGGIQDLKRILPAYREDVINEWGRQAAESMALLNRLSAAEEAEDLDTFGALCDELAAKGLLSREIERRKNSLIFMEKLNGLEESIESGASVEEVFEIVQAIKALDACRAGEDLDRLEQFEREANCLRENEITGLLDEITSHFEEEEFEQAKRKHEHTLSRFPEDRRLIAIGERIESDAARYTELIGQAGSLCHSEEYDEALPLIEEAAKLFPESKPCERLLERIRTQAKEQAERAAAIGASAPGESERASSLRTAVEAAMEKTRYLVPEEPQPPREATVEAGGKEKSIGLVLLAGALLVYAAFAIIANIATWSLGPEEKRAESGVVREERVFSGLKNPYGVAVDSEGNVLVVDRMNNRVVKFNSMGKMLTMFGKEGSGDGEFNLPRNIAVGPEGSIYVVDGGNHRIQVFNASGEFVRKWGGEGESSGRFKFPWGIAVHQDRFVYVSDSNNHRIQIFSTEGRFLRQWGGRGSTRGKFNDPRGICVDSEGNVYVADSGNHWIQKFTSNGRAISIWGGRGSSQGKFERPSGVRVDRRGEVYVADKDNGRIQVFSAQGRLRTVWHSSSAAARFSYPADIEFDDGGRVFVVDAGRNCLFVLDRSGRLEATWGR